ncbi:MAG: tetratricopeptide repeat protein [Candidatus Acidiferrales bacterium]|jgi:tetratricopeptide (TPR) repeat protein
MSATSPSTASEESPRIRSRELVSILCVLALVLLLALTALLSRMYHKKIHTLADAMFAQGEADEQAGQVKLALADYRNALAYNPSNPPFQFHLAKALAAAGRGEEARSYLLNLLSESPGSGEVNLELARIAAHNNSMADAMRYYQGAVYGEWASDPIGMRWQVRRELCEFLLSRGAMKQAAPEVIALEENTPAGDVARLKVVAQLLLRTQQWNRALDVYRTLLAAAPNDEELLAGAAQCAFELGQYVAAMEYFDRLPRDGREARELAYRYDVTRRIFAADPFLSGLSAGVRVQRVANALSLAQTRAENCARQTGQSLEDTPPRTDLQRIYQQGKDLQQDWAPRYLQRFPDRLDAAMAYVFSIETATAAACGEPQGDDRALWLLGRSRSVVNR